MCDVSALVTGAIGAGSSLAEFGQQKQAARQANAQAYQNYAYQLAQQAIGEKYRTEMIRFNTEGFSRDIDYSNDVLDYQKGEFARQEKLIDNARKAIDTNYINKISTVLQRQVEEQIATAFGIETVESESRRQRATAQVQADARGVEGTSVDAIIGDVMRQEGQAVAVLEMNRSATQRQLTLEALGIKAESDAALYNLPINTYAPTAPINTPAPVAPVGQAQAPQYTAGPSSASLWMNMGSAVGKATAQGLVRTDNNPTLKSLLKL